MDAIVLIALCLLLALLVGVFVQQRRTSGSAASAAETDIRQGIGEVVSWVRERQPAVPVLAELVRDLDATNEPPNGGESLVQVVGDSKVLVYGTETSAQRLGTVIGRAAQPLATAGRRATSAATAGIEAAKQTGFLVELSPESRAAWKSQEHIRAAGGYVLGVLRDGEKKFSHVVKIRPARLAQTVASGAAILSAVAAQAQLDQIEHQLGEIADEISSLRADVRDRHQAELLAALRLLGEIYAAARASGVLTPAMWDQIAPIAHTIYTLQEESGLRLRRARAELGDLAQMKVVERKERLVKLAEEIDYSLRLPYSEERAVVQFQLLRVWHLAAQRDPSLEHALKEIVADSHRRRDALRELQQTMTTALANPDVAPLIQRARIFSRRKIRQSATELIALVDSRTGSVIDLPLLQLDAS